jgi:hypothetical protein
VDLFEAELDAAIQGVPYREHQRPELALVPPASFPSVQTQPQTTTKVKRVADFKCIKMDWLKDKPTDPGICVQFSSEHGDSETYYHTILGSEAVLYLVFDQRCKFGRFVPKMNGLVTMTFGGRTVRGTLWSAAKFVLGVLEITPFVLVSEDFEEKPQPQLKPQPTRIPDYDWDLGNLEN